MRFDSTEVEGVMIVDLEPHADERGSFARAFCSDEFEQHGLEAHVAQANLSMNRRAGTLRGLHHQIAPHKETKFVRCVEGAVFDVAVDLRTQSPTYGKWMGVELTSGNGRGLFIPPGCAHGFQTLEDNTTLLYLVGAAYAPGHEAGLHYADPLVGICWPLPVSSISEKDASWPFLEPASLEQR